MTNKHYETCLFCQETTDGAPLHQHCYTYLRHRITHARAKMLITPCVEETIRIDERKCRRYEDWQAAQGTPVEDPLITLIANPIQMSLI